MTGKELSAVLAECAARTEIARAGVEAARAGIEEDRRKHEAVMAEQKAAIAKHEAVIGEQKAATEKWEKIAAETWAATKRIEKAAAEQRARFDASGLKADAIIAELKEHRDERRALLEAIFRVIDRLDRQQPPPPNLRTV